MTEALVEEASVAAAQVVEVFTWTDERVELLKKLWADGLLASQIANELGGVTRNAVIGKVHRLGLSGRPRSGGRTRGKSGLHPLGMWHLTVVNPVVPVLSKKIKRSDFGTFYKFNKPIAPTPLPGERISDVLPEQRKRLLELDLRDCRWPYGDGSFTFCGRSRIMGLRSGISPHRSYCPEHAALAKISRVDAALCGTLINRRLSSR